MYGRSGKGEVTGRRVSDGSEDSRVFCARYGGDEFALVLYRRDRFVIREKEE